MFAEVNRLLGVRATGMGASGLLRLPFLALAFLFPAGLAAADVDPIVFAQAGHEHFYNVEYDEAIADFEKAVASDPQNPLFYNYLANAYLFREMRRLGLLDGNLYDASNGFLESKKAEPNPAEIQRINRLLDRVRGMCEARLKKNPRDVDALYALGVTHAIVGSMKFTIDKSWTEALRAGGRANEYHEKVLALDPNYHDAKLVIGMYQYIVGSIPRSVKWLAFLLGYHGSRTRGVELMQDVEKKKPFALELNVGGRLVAACRERGLISRNIADSYLLAPPLVTSPEQIDRIVEIVRDSAKEVVGWARRQKAEI